MAQPKRAFAIRVQIIQSEIMADTHPDAPDGVPDEESVVLGADGVVLGVGAIVRDYHGAEPETIAGLRSEQLVKRIPTLRVYLTAGMGQATLRIPYTPDGSTPWQVRAFVRRLS